VRRSNEKREEGKSLMREEEMLVVEEGKAELAAR